MKSTCRNIICFALIFSALIISNRSFAQEKEDVIQIRVEFISEQFESEEIDLTDVVASLNYYYDHPLNLNNATEEELQSLGLLTDIQINDLLLHIKLFGKLISIYELQSLTYWDIQTIRIVEPFVKVDDKLDQLSISPKEVLKYGVLEAYFRFQTTPEFKAGYEDVPDSILNTSNSYYHGDPNKYYSRFRFSYRTNISVGVTAEKDPGEEFFRGSEKRGFDFYSAHAFFKGGKYLRAVALGDYQIQIGQGLNLWSGYAFGKTADVTNVKKSANPLKPYTSVDENRFLRGAAVDLGYKNLRLMMFGSNKQVDGSIINDSLIEEQRFISSINLTGFHRTNSEIDRRHTLNEGIFGANLRYETRTLSFGIAATNQSYNNAYIKDTVPYNQFDFRGDNTTAISGNYSWVKRNFNFFGETSYSSHSNSFANIHGLLFSIDHRASMALVYRNYERGYHSFYNAGFSEGSKTQNEKGLYAGLKFKLSKSITVNSYVDMFKFPWLKYQVSAPSEGYEVMVQPSYKPSRSLEIYARFRQQSREKNSRDSDGSIVPLEEIIQRNYRLNFDFAVTKEIRLKSRIEYVTIHRKSNKPEDGVILYQDILYKPKNFPVDFSLRYALFDTDSYDSRIYAYENNALYVFSVPSYYYTGSRAYVLLRYKFLRKFDLWVKYGVNLYDNRSAIGSGAEEILGNRKSDITVQLRVKF